MLETLKLVFKAKPKTLALLVFLIVSFAILHMFSVWQLDLICSSPVWKPGWSHPNGRYADDPFECWLWRTTVGEAYNVLLFLNFISLYGTITSFIILLYYAMKSLRLEKGRN
jgi:hypothetical protein